MGKDLKDARAAKGCKKTLGKLKKRKLKKTGVSGETAEADSVFPESGHNLGILKAQKPIKEKKKHKLAKLKERREQRNDIVARCGDQLPHKGKQRTDQTCGTAGDDSNARSKNDAFAEFEEANIGKKKKVKKAGKSKKKDLHVLAEESELEENHNEKDPAKVDEIALVDEDCSRGMKKWLISYKESRPGLKILQHRIDEFVTAYEVQQEQERKEREARVAEEGWTVVVHHKGRKKTTDSETGITVGSVAQAVVMDKVAKRKRKEVALDFYRFQKREAQRNEVMMLQNKFEQDRKRIQQLRAARKFRPY